jgi:hypothetical protein
MTSELATTTTAPAPLAFLHDGAAFDHLWRVAKAFSLSGMVPEHFRGKPESCMVALMYAEQLGEHPMVMFQEVTVIKGRPGTSARFAIARANKSGLLAGPITWTAKGQGEALEVTATATMRESGEKISATVTMREAIADGWTRNDKYKSIPGQMLRWRAATRLINLYIPEVLFGLGVREEAETRIQRAAVSEVETTGDPIADLNRQIAAAAEAPDEPPAETAAPRRRRAAPAPEPEVIDDAVEAEIVTEPSTPSDPSADPF